MHKSYAITLLCACIAAWSPISCVAWEAAPNPEELGDAATDAPDSRPATVPIHSSLPVVSQTGTQRTSKSAAGQTKAGADSEENSDPKEVKFKEPIRITPAVTYGTPPWATGPRRVASSMPSAPPARGPNQAAPAVMPVAGNGEVELEKRTAEEKVTLNVHIVRHYHLPPVDTVKVYPWPVRPPKPVIAGKLQEKPAELKPMILATGYSSKIDFRRPFPLYGWRWVHAFTVAHAKSGLGYPHTMLTMYSWTDKMVPYVVPEIKRINALEEARQEAWKRVNEDYEANHVELENEAAAKGLFPVEIKLDHQGVGQATLPPGNWWVSATRKLPDLKFYWQVPITATRGQTVNVQLTNVNAIVVQGGW